MASLKSILYHLLIGASIASPVKRDDSDNPSLDGYLVFPQGMPYSCNAGRQTVANSAFQDAMYLAGQRGAGGKFVAPDWKSADFELANTWFGPLGPVNRASKHRSIANNLQRISNPRWLYKSKDLPSSDRFLEVYCPTPDNPTYDKNGDKTCQNANNPASTINVGFALGGNNKNPQVNLCPAFFQSRSQDSWAVLKDMEANPSRRDSLQTLYSSKGAIFLHELHHIQYKFDNDGVFKNGLTAPQCIDHKIDGLPGLAYGPNNAKYLAEHYGSEHTTNNVDNYVCFILASVVKDSFGTTPNGDESTWNRIGNFKRDNPDSGDDDDDDDDEQDESRVHARQEEGEEEGDDDGDDGPLTPDPTISDDNLQPLDYIVADPMSDTVHDALSLYDRFMPDTPTAPTCYGGAGASASASQELLSGLIAGFCSSIANSRLSLGCQDDASDPFEPVQTFRYSVSTGAEDVAVGISVSYDPDWQGSGPLMTLEEDCVEMLGIALNGCDTDTTSAKHGGLVRDMGRIYDLSVHTLDQPGDADWVPTNQFVAAGGCKAV